MLSTSAGDQDCAGTITVTINGQGIEVGVSPGGMFYDKATKTISATTLESLKKKLIKEQMPTGGIPVEDWDSGRRGICIGRPQGHGWRSRSYWRVRWSDAEITEVSYYSLVAPTNPEIRTKYTELEADASKKKEIYEAALKAKEASKPNHLDETLKLAFPLRK